MKRTLIKTSVAALTLACAAIPSLVASPDHFDEHDYFGHRGHHARKQLQAVYSMSNDASGNEVLIFNRDSDGMLSSPTSVSTGGLGTSGGLGNQGALAMAENGKWLLVVNAGSDSISIFRVTDDGLELADVEPSQGVRPVSLTVGDELVYVLNAGDDSIAGFVIGEDGDLLAVDYSKRFLSGTGVGAAQIGFSPNGRELVVTEKGTNLISVYSVCHNGYADAAPATTLSSTPTPFGFAFRRDGLLIVSEAAGGAPDAGALSSYRIKRDDSLVAIDPSALTTESAACWVAIDPQGRFAYTTNSGSASISGYRILGYGNLKLLDADGVTGETGAGPIDMAFSDRGRFLYSLNSGDHSISVFRVGSNGSLSSIQTVNGLPETANGMAAF